MNDIKTCIRCKEDKECPYGRRICKECQRLFCREYKAKNREKIAEYNRKYKAEHKEEISDYNQKYNKENREAIQTRQTIQHRERRQIDYNYKKTLALRKSLQNIMNNRIKYSKILDCSRDTLIEWLQFNFAEDMNMDNYRELWCLDHVMPCSIFDFEKNKEDEIRCFHWSNLRPLYVNENARRQNRVTREEIEVHEKKIKNFVDIKKEETLSLIHYDKFQYLNEQ
jgi:hypothetical protein